MHLLLEETQIKNWVSLLHNKIPEELLLLCDPNGDYYWDKVEEKNIKYFARQCVGHPWANQFALALMCLSDRNLTPQSIMNITSVLNARFRVWNYTLQDKFYLNIPIDNGNLF